MFEFRVNRRALISLGAVALLGGCQVIPKGPVIPAPAPTPTPTPTSSLPVDQQRHRVALLLPLSGSNAGVGQSIANATTMALIDTGAENLRITTYDTATGAKSAAARAIADGNRLILGPLLSDDVVAVAGVARPAQVPMISYSNDAGAAAPDTFVMGHVPSESIVRTVQFAKASGVSRFAALIPTGVYGQRASSTLYGAVRDVGGTIAAIETFDRGNTSIISAAGRLKAQGEFGAVLIADSAKLAAMAAPTLKAGHPDLRLLGTELWSGESEVATSPAMRGAWFSAISDTRYRQFVDSYRARFGNPPYRIATLGYDSVLLAIRVARDWQPGTTFPTAALYDKGGFLGLDGAFRFKSSGVAERSWEVREAAGGTIDTVSPAPPKFAD